MPQFTADNAAVTAKTSHYPGRRYRQHAPVRQAIHIQQLLHDSATILADDLKLCQDEKLRAALATSLASCAKGFQAMGEQIRVLKGKPLPGSLRPESKPKKPKRASVDPTFKESLSPPQPSPLPDPIDPCI